ncbi:hypothetical protein RR46_14232 [Papilio xuthus]|uniref:Uncharacterized protein n=1 Tax=Papilio xuthus TaxID=66420 RepID=A0A194PHW6_PAPXU|nr:hypothetical protein RR46_14232 [Papilio xuthus]
MALGLYSHYRKHESLDFVTYICLFNRYKDLILWVSDTEITVSNISSSLSFIVDKTVIICLHFYPKHYDLQMDIMIRVKCCQETKNPK